MKKIIIKPAEDAREMFAGEFYRYMAPVDDDFMISPAAVMKVLLVLAQGAHESLADDILWDLAIKHIKQETIAEHALHLGVVDLGNCIESRRKLMNKMKEPIEENLLREFLKNDFKELGDLVTIKNYFVVKDKLRFKTDFQEFAKNYFNFNCLSKNAVFHRRSLVDLRFSRCLTERDMDIFGLVEFKFHCKSPFVMYADGSLGAYGKFKYAVLAVTTGLYFGAEVVEIPLKSRNHVQLSMLVFLPSDLTILLKRNIGRDYTDYNEISNQMTEKVVDIKLPKIQLQKKYDLASYFAEQAEYGLRDCFTGPVNFKRIFERAEKREIKIGKYCQHTSLFLTATKTSAPATIQADKTTDKIFDARDSSFFYVIKSEKVLYAMGHFYKENEEDTSKRKS